MQTRLGRKKFLCVLFNTLALVIAGATLLAGRPALATSTNNTLSLSGKSTYWLGANYAWYNYGTDFGTGAWGKFTDWTSVNNDFAKMDSEGVHIVRWWVFADGRYSPEFNSSGSVTGLDSHVLPDIDEALTIAAQNHIELLLTLMDNSMWSPASYSGSLKMGGHAAIVTNASVQETYLVNALKPLVQHITASAYHTQVAGYDIVNEPEGQIAGYWGGSNLSKSEVQTFVHQCAHFIHVYGNGAYATVGSAAPYYVAAWKGLGLDFYQFHYYPWMDFNGAPGSGLPSYASLTLDKPCIVGEFPTVDTSYGLTDSSPLSAEWYLNTIYNQGYAGALAWSYHVADSATNWATLQPVFTNWNTLYSAYVGP